MDKQTENYYGLAIRQITDVLSKMRNTVGAVIYHSSEAGFTEARHRFCDKKVFRTKIMMGKFICMLQDVFEYIPRNKF